MVYFFIIVLYVLIMVSIFISSSYSLALVIRHYAESMQDDNKQNIYSETYINKLQTLFYAFFLPFLFLAFILQLVFISTIDPGLENLWAYLTSSNLSIIYLLFMHFLLLDCERKAFRIILVKKCTQNKVDDLIKSLDFKLKIGVIFLLIYLAAIFAEKYSAVALPFYLSETYIASLLLLYHFFIRAFLWIKLQSIGKITSNKILEK